MGLSRVQGGGRGRDPDPYVLLHLDRTAVPALARIYERALKSRLYAGDLPAGRALVHKDDMIDAFRG